MDLIVWPWESRLCLSGLISGLIRRLFHLQICFVTVFVDFTHFKNKTFGWNNSNKENLYELFKISQILMVKYIKINNQSHFCPKIWLFHGENKAEPQVVKVWTNCDKKLYEKVINCTTDTSCYCHTLIPVQQPISDRESQHDIVINYLFWEGSDIDLVQFRLSQYNFRFNFTLSN